MMKYKTESYFSKKQNKQVTDEVLVLAAKDAMEIGLGAKDIIIGKFKFAPQISRDLVAKTGPRAGSKFSIAKGIFTWENVPAEEESHLNQYGGIKIDFTKALKDFDYKKIDWENDRVAFYLRPYEINGAKKWAIACDKLRPLSADEIEAATELRKDVASFTETELTVEFETDGKTTKLTIPRWAILLDDAELASLANQ